VIVVEASAMVDALVGNPADPHLLAAIADEDLHAPALLDFEVASALRGHLLAGKLSQARCAEAVEDFAALNIERHQMTALRDNFTVYDAAYVVLAQALDAPLVTADLRMREAEKAGITVHVYRRLST
jgi:predicted nucleic acid-binding protein